MRSWLEFVTPYRRVCGVALLLIVSVLGPNLHFFVGTAVSEPVALAALCGLYALFAGFALLPVVRHVSERASFIALFAVGALIAAAYGLDGSIKEALARGAGMFDDPAPWSRASTPQSAQPFVHPMAGYTIRVSSAWKQTPGPMTGTNEFALQREGTTLAMLRPSCDVDETPLAVTVRGLQAQWPDLRRTCSRWRGLEACLLRRDLPEPKAEWWNWIARRPGSSRAIRLEFFVYAPRAESDVYATINSVEPAAMDFTGPSCPTPLEWATPF